MEHLQTNCIFLPSLQALHQNFHYTLPAAAQQTHRLDPLPVHTVQTEHLAISIYLLTAMWKLYLKFIAQITKYQNFEI